MRRCSNCNRIYPSSDDYRFCRVDGTSLLSESEAAEALTLQNVPVDMPTLKIPEGMVVTQNAAALEMAERVSKNRWLEQLRADLHRSEEALKYAHAAVDALLDDVQQQVREINDSFSNVKIKYLITDERQVALTSEGYGVKISWQQCYVNTLRESRLVVVEYRRGRTASDEREFAKVVFAFDVSADFQPVWRDRQRIVSTDVLAQECVNRLMTLLTDRPEAEQIGKDPIQLSEDEVRQPEGVSRKTPEGVFPVLRFNMAVSDKSAFMNEGDDVHFRGLAYLVYKKEEHRHPAVSEDCDEFWLSPK
jgi:hypothetical protein